MKEFYSFETPANENPEVLPEEVIVGSELETELVTEAEPILDLVPKPEGFNEHLGTSLQEQEGIDDSSLEKRQKSFFDSCRQSFNKITQVAAMIAVFSGSLSEASVRESRSKEDEKSSLQNRDRTEQVQRAKEDREYKENLERVNSICQKHGLDIMAIDPKKIDLFIPDEKVEKVIVHLGQTHKIHSYNKESWGDRREIVNSQNDIYNLLNSIHKNTGEVETCLVEGLSTDEEVESILNNEKTHIDLRSHFLDVASNTSIDIDTEIKRCFKISSDSAKSANDSGLKDAILFDVNRSIQKILLECELDQVSKERLAYIAEKIGKETNYDSLIYTLGGAVVAAKLDHVVLKPAEDKFENEKVAKKVCQELNITVHKGENYYDVIYKLPREKRDKALALNSTYGLSKDREKHAMKHASKVLIKKEMVIKVYGANHDFKDVLMDERKEGAMRGVALIKINSEDLPK